MVDRDRFMNFVGLVNPYSGRFLSNDNDSAPTADYLGLTRPQILKIGMCMFNCAGFITTAIGLTYGLQQCKSAFPEIELPININATQDLINKIDDRNYLRHNCEEDLKKLIFYSAIGFHLCLSIVHLMAMTSCLSTLGSSPSRMLNYIHGSNAQRDQEAPTLLPMVGSGGPSFPPFPLVFQDLDLLGRSQLRQVLNRDANVFRDSDPPNGEDGARASSDPSNPTSSPSAISIEVSQNPSPRVVNV